MSKWNQSLAALVAVGALFGASAQTATEHQQHHPAGTAPWTVAQATTPAGVAASGGMAMMGNIDRHMQAMQEIRAKLMATKTPAERQALMAEQMKMMQDGMAMMQSMGGMQGMQGMGGMQGGGMGGMQGGGMGDMGGRMQMMEKRMEMMQTMMQSVIDRLPPLP